METTPKAQPVVEHAQVFAMSSFPSWLKSAITIEVGPRGVFQVGASKNIWGVAATVVPSSNRLRVTESSAKSLFLDIRTLQEQSYFCLKRRVGADTPGSLALLRRSSSSVLGYSAVLLRQVKRIPAVGAEFAMSACAITNASKWDTECRAVQDRFCIS